jgi:hypothetical protein
MYPYIQKPKHITDNYIQDMMKSTSTISMRSEKLTGFIRTLKNNVVTLSGYVYIEIILFETILIIEGVAFSDLWGIKVAQQTRNPIVRGN